VLNETFRVPESVQGKGMVVQEYREEKVAVRSHIVWRRVGGLPKEDGEPAEGSMPLIKRSSSSIKFEGNASWYRNMEQ
jgi:hypothetical protein